MSVINMVKGLLGLESANHRKLSVILHLSIAIYLIILLFMDKRTPPDMLVLLGLFTIFYGITIVIFGVMFRIK